MTKKWAADWNGHEILACNRPFGETLFIDNARSDDRCGPPMNSELSGRITDPDGTEHDVKVEFRPGSLGMGIACHIYVDGEFVGGDRVRRFWGR